MTSRITLLAFATALLVALDSPTVATQGQTIGLNSGEVTIHRDEYGVPHVFGSTLEAVWFGVGYAQGQDRLW